MEVNVVTLEDNKEYIIIYALENDLGKYLFLSEDGNERNFTIRKIIEKEGKEYLSQLASEDEYDQVMLDFRNSDFVKGAQNEE